MFDDTIHDLFNKLRGQKNDQSLNVSKSAISSADQSLIIDKADQPGWWSRFKIKESGGYHYKYYHKDEVGNTTRLALLKVASVTLATYSFMKAVSPAFESGALKSLPSVYGVDPKLILTAATATGFWWVLSKLDTAVLHNMRDHSTSIAVEEEYGIPRSKSRAISPSVGGAIRYGVSVGSLAISIPALLVTVAEIPVDNYMRNRIKTEYNDPIMADYRRKLERITGEITRLTGLLAPLERRLIEIDADGDALIYTEEQQQRRAALSERLRLLEDQRRELELNRLEQTRNRDAAISRIAHERDGINGLVRGCRPEVPVAPRCDAAMADRDDATRRLETINSTITGFTTQIGDINTELSNIDRSAQTTLENRNRAEATLRMSLQDQISVIRGQLDTQNQLRASASDITTLAENDPRWVTYDPNLFSQIDGYIEYMKKEANAFQWLSAGAMALMITCLELGVFAMAASRKVSNSEKRAYLAEILKSDEAGKIYQQILSRRELEEEVGLDPVIRQLRKTKKVMEEEDKIFDQVLRKAMKDSGIEEEMYDDIIADLQELRYKRSHKMNDVPSAHTTAAPESDIDPEVTPARPKANDAPRPDHLA